MSSRSSVVEQRAAAALLDAEVIQYRYPVIG